MDLFRVGDRSPPRKYFVMNRILFFACTLTVFLLAGSICHGGDLTDIKEKGVLRHLGIPYANFVTGGGDGMDVDLVRLFAKDLGVKYEYVPVDWNELFPALIGRKIKVKGTDVEFLEDSPVRGDIKPSDVS